MSQAIHWNFHLLCAVDIETTGLDHEKHEVIQIAIVPLNGDCTVNTKIIPFYTEIKPEKEPKDWDRAAMRCNKLDMVKLMYQAMDKWKVADLLEEWFEKLKLPFGKKILPLAHNWPFEQRFLHTWLGEATMSHLFFNHRDLLTMMATLNDVAGLKNQPIPFPVTYRDTMAMANSINDIADVANEPWPFPKVGLTYLCSQLGVVNKNPHDALGDAVATAECYRKMLQKFKLLG